MNRLLLSTTSLASAERARHWAAMVCDTFVELDCDIPAPDTFGGSIDCFQGKPLQFFNISSSPHGVRRTRSRIARSSQDDFLLILQTAGRGFASQAGRKAVTNVGDFTLVDTTRPYALQFDHDFSQIVLRLPRERTLGSLPLGEDLTATVVHGGDGAGKLASAFVRQLPDVAGQMAPAQLGRIQDIAIDLATTAAMARAQEFPSATQRHHAALRHRIHAYIDRHFDDTSLSSESIAAAHGISPRYLSKIHAQVSLQVSQMIWARRLEQARRNLVDPLRAQVSVTTIGHAVGFKDAAHFSRMFKSAFGETPSAFRARHVNAMAA